MKMQVLTAVALAAIMAAGPTFAAAATTTTATPSAPAAAAPAAPKAKPKTHYYIAQAADTKVCSIVTKKPDGKTSTMVGKYWYATEAKAAAALKHQAACKTA